jgi:hypothetical protein
MGVQGAEDRFPGIKSFKLGGNPFETQDLPLTLSALEKSGDKIGHVVAAVDQYGRELKMAKRQAADSARRLAALKRDRGKVRVMTAEEYEQDIETVAARVSAGLKLEKPQGSSLHHLMQYIEETNDEVNDEMRRWIDEKFQSIVVEHDWAAAFEGTEEFDTGDFNFPYDYTCFEFRVSGLRVLLLVGLDDTGGYRGILVTGVNGRWYINAEKFTFVDGKITGATIGRVDEIGRAADKFLAMLGRQVRAVCIMLEADVAVGEVKKAPEALNARRRSMGRSVLKDYHVVSLKRRGHQAGRETTGEGTRKRCHWRRGHWRHYKNGHAGTVKYLDGEGQAVSKSWIKWHLVGDPELGFVDKHYKL